MFNLPPPELQGAWGWSLPAALACQEGKAKRDLSYGNCKGGDAGDACNHPAQSLGRPVGLAPLLRGDIQEEMLVITSAVAASGSGSPERHCL